MNLANTIRLMAEKKDAPPFDVSKADYAGAAKELTQYAKTKGGMDKDDFLSMANRMASIAKKKSPNVMAKFARDLGALDTSPREKVVSVMRNNGIKVTMGNRGLQIEEHDVEEWEELDEAKVQGKEVFDKTFANRTQADNFAKKNGGRVKQVGRVFYVFKEAPEDDEPASPDEGSMALQQLEFIEYAADKLSDHIEDGGDFPEWMQNKLATVNDQMQSLYSQIDQDGSDQMDEAYKTPAEAKAYEDGKKAVAKKVSYDDNPNKKGTKEYTAWSKGHNDARAKMIGNRFSKEEVELEESPMVTFTVPNVTSDMASKLERTAKEKNIEYSRKGRTVVLKGKRIDMTMLRTKMGLAQTNIPMVPVKEEVELDENAGLIKDYQGMKAQGKKDSNILDALMSMPKYKRMSKDQMAKIIGDAKRKGIFKEEVELDEAMRVLATKGKTKVVTKGDGLARVMVGNKEVASGDFDDGADGWFMSKKGEKGQKFFDSAKKIADFYAEEVEIEEAYKTPSEAGAYEAGKKAAREGKKYQDNPNKKGTAEFTAWSKGHNEARAKGMKEEVNLDELFESAFEEEKLSLEDTLKAIWEGKKLDPVNKKALKKDFDDRKDKDIDNDGDVDDSDEYMHKKRQAVSKAIEKDSDKAEAEQEKEVSDKEDEPKGKVGKSNKQTKVDVNPSIEEEKGEEMTSAEMEKKDEIMKSLEKKKDEFVKKYGDRAKEVMARTAIKMAKKHA